MAQDNWDKLKRVLVNQGFDPIQFPGIEREMMGARIDMPTQAKFNQTAREKKVCELFGILGYRVVDVCREMNISRPTAIKYHNMCRAKGFCE